MQLFVALAAAAYAPALHPNHSPTRLAVSRHSFLTMQEDEPAEAAPPPPPPPPPPPAFIPGETCTGEKVAVVGATGYIGKAVVREAVRRGYQTTAVVRDPAAAAAEPKFAGANVVQADVTVPSTLTGPLGSADVVISCLASRSGSKKDSFAIDYQATLNCLEAAKAAGARHFVMLSAFCVKSAEIGDEYALQFQYAKKDMEAALRSQSDVSYTIVRPTAFFKSVSGQVEVVDGGGPFVYFDLGGGKCATCNPIAEADLAAALVDTIGDKTKENMLWNLGGPDEGLSMKQQVCRVQQQHTLFHSFFAALALTSHPTTTTSGRARRGGSWQGVGLSPRRADWHLRRHRQRPPVGGRQGRGGSAGCGPAGGAFGEAQRRGRVRADWPILCGRRHAHDRPERKVREDDAEAAL